MMENGKRVKSMEKVQSNQEAIILVVFGEKASSQKSNDSLECSFDSP